MYMIPMEEFDNKAQRLIDSYIDGEESERESNIVEHALQRYAEGKSTIDEQIDLHQESLDTFRKVHARIHPKKVRLFTWRIPVAAAILLCFGLGLFLVLRKADPVGVEIVAGKDVAPGNVGATLTLANGQKILLSNAANGELAKEAGVVITKSADGQLVYELKGGGDGRVAQINRLSTANGETYQVVLPDQSRVWLNAASSLKYSSALGYLDKREVELVGEGYFEVAKDKLHPFIVRSNGQSVEVLGTHFNVKAYSDEKIFRTTLLEGSVKLLAERGAQILKPEQQGVMNDGRVALRNVDVEQAVAWKNGKFMFDDERLDDIMKQVSRWYDVEVVFEDGFVRDIKLWGSVSRFGKVSEVLGILQRTGNVHFKIDGKRIYVSN